MNNKLSLLIGALSFVAVAGAKAQTAVTDPVGYITHAIAGNTAGGASGADTIIGPVLQNRVEFAGATTADPSGSTSLTFASGVPTGLNNDFYVEIRTGAREGWWSVVSASTATSITTVDALPAGLGGPIQVIVRKITTLRDFLGANSIGLVPVDNVAPKPDEIQILDPQTQVTKIAVYVLASVGVPADGWYDFVTQDNLDNSKLYPGTAIKVRRFGATGTSLVSVGHVKTTKTEIDIFPRDNWVAPTLAVGGTMGTLNFASQLNKEDGNDLTNPPADLLQIIRANQSTDVFVALDPSLGAGNIMANFVTQADATNELVKEGTGVIISRAASAAAGVYVAPAQTIAP